MVSDTPSLSMFEVCAAFFIVSSLCLIMIQIAIWGGSLGSNMKLLSYWSFFVYTTILLFIVQSYQEVEHINISLLSNMGVLLIYMIFVPILAVLMAKLFVDNSSGYHKQFTKNYESLIALEHEELVSFSP